MALGFTKVVKFKCSLHVVPFSKYSLCTFSSHLTPLICSNEVSADVLFLLLFREVLSLAWEDFRLGEPCCVTFTLCF